MCLKGFNLSNMISAEGKILQVLRKETNTSLQYLYNLQWTNITGGKLFRKLRCAFTKGIILSHNYISYLESAGDPISIVFESSMSMSQREISSCRFPSTGDLVRRGRVR